VIVHASGRHPAQSPDDHRFGAGVMCARPLIEQEMERAGLRKLLVVAEAAIFRIEAFFEACEYMRGGIAVQRSRIDRS
jgi:hypothetical protein